MANAPDPVVWDPFIRLFHWGLALAVGIGAATGFLADAPWIAWHIWAGTAAVTLVGLRGIWGFVGPGPARFANFVAGPRAVLAHLRGGARHRGHNPLGGWMVLALIGVVALIALTGVITLGGELKAGPLGYAISFATGQWAVGWHEPLAIALLVLVGLHVAGVLYESWHSRENLARAMVTGVKAIRPGDAPEPVARARPGFALACGGAAMLCLGSVGWRMAQWPALGAPVAQIDPTYAAACAECHIAYHPSLLPRASWTAMMAGLTDHFGENAALDPAKTAAIATWLDAHAAETADTKAANRLRVVDPAHPLAITQTPFWVRKHGQIAAATFTAPPVRAKGNCTACHGDAATGAFYPGRIEIPDPAKS